MVVLARTTKVGKEAAMARSVEEGAPALNQPRADGKAVSA